MAFAPHVWNQLKNLTAKELAAALVKDGFSQDAKGGSQIIYWHPEGRRRVSVHMHPQKTYGPNMLKGLLDDAGWSEDDMRRLKLIR